MSNKVIAGFSDSRHSILLAKNIAKLTKSPVNLILAKKFPDGETNLRFSSDVKGKTVYLMRPLKTADEDINNNMMKAIFAAQTAKDLGAARVILVAPYLAYMRQDKRFRPYEAISSRIMANLFSRCFDELITFDPHLHRYRSLSEIFTIKTKRLSADALLAEYIKKNYKNPIILGPDEESYQWARDIAKMIGCPVDVLKKHRYTAESVKIKIKDRLNLKNKSVAIVDDMVSTGHTMIEVIKDAKKLGARKVYCVCVHGLFVENAYEKMKRAGAREVVSTNTIANNAAKIDISKLLAESIIKE